MKTDYNADIYYFDYQADAKRMGLIIDNLKKGYDAIVVGIHNYTRYPANNFGISSQAIQLLNQIQKDTKSLTFFFGNPYAIKNVCNATNIFACYEDDDVFQNATADILQGLQQPKGKLPVTICSTFPFGTGIVKSTSLQFEKPAALALTKLSLMR